MAAGDFRGAGSVTLPASGPGATATVTKSVGSLATTDVVMVTLSSTSAQSLGNRLKEVKWQVVKASGQFILSTDAEQTPELVFDYLVITTA